MLVRVAKFSSENQQSIWAGLRFYNKSLTVLLCFALCSSQQAVYAQDEAIDSRVIESQLSQAVDEDKPVIRAAVESFVEGITGQKNTESVTVSEDDSSNESTVNFTLNEASFSYTGDKSGNPFVPTGALASELGLDSRVERNSNGGSTNSNNVEVANIIVNSEVEEVEVVVNNPRALEPLEYFKKEELQYTGRLTNKYGKPIALISGPDGLMYKAGVGDRVGRSQAQVAEISNNNIEIRTGSQKDVIPLTKVKP